MAGRKPRAIVVVSAHYDGGRGDVVKIGGASSPTMLYDYGGFPPESYKLQYPCPGAPDVAARAAELLAAAGLKAEVETRRPLDHGVFVPLVKMWPAADVPVVPLSVLPSQDPAAHVAVGRALAPLRDEGVFFLGSGVSNHNFAYLFGRQQPETAVIGEAFHDRLNSLIRASGTGSGDTCAEGAPSAATPDAAAALLKELLNYATWPGAEEAVPRGGAEHWMPFFTCLGTSRYFAPSSVSAAVVPPVNGARAPRVLFEGDKEVRPGDMLRVAAPSSHVVFED